MLHVFEVNKNADRWKGNAAEVSEVIACKVSTAAAAIFSDPNFAFSSPIDTISYRLMKTNGPANKLNYTISNFLGRRCQMVQQIQFTDFKGNRNCSVPD